MAGGCELAAVEAVCADGVVARDTLFDLLGGLVTQSLVAVEYRGEAARYRLLETVREHAAERLAAAGETDASRCRHRDWALAATEGVRRHMNGPERGVWLERLEAEHHNMRAALGWSLRVADAPAALRLATALQPLWRVRAHFEEGRGWLARALACAGEPPPRLRAAALGAAGGLAYSAGDPDAMGALAEEELSIFRELDDRRGMARALIRIGGAAHERRDTDGARAAWGESARLMHEVNDQDGIANALTNLGTIAMDEDDFARAVDFYEQSLRLTRSLGRQDTLPNLVRILCDALLELGDYARAQTYADEGLAVCRELGERWNAAGLLGQLAQVAVAKGDLARAVALHERSLAQHREVGNAWSTAEGLYLLARALLRRDDAARAGPLLEESLALCRRLRHGEYLPRVLRSLGDAARLRGDSDQAATYLAESLDEGRAQGEWKEVARTLESIAAAIAGAQPDRAIRLLAAAAVLRETARAPRLPHVDPPIDDLVGALRARLGEPTFATAWTGGAAMSPDEALAYALANTGPHL